MKMHIKNIDAEVQGFPSRAQKRFAMKVCAVWTAILFVALNFASAQVRIINGVPVPMPGGPTSDSPPSSSGSSSSSSSGQGSGPWLPAEPVMSGVVSTNQSGTNDEIQLSFQGANIDMIVQWLAQNTGKTVIKHPQVQCQLTITSSKKVSTREAIVLIYRALALEGFTAIESARSILIVPEGKEPRMSPELVTGSITNIPEGRQRLVKVFQLSHIQASDLRDRIKIALTDKAIVDVDEKNNRLTITDFNDNIRIASGLIEALDTDQPEDVAVRTITLKNVGALALAKEIQPLYQKAGGKSLDISADERANALIVLSSQSAFEAINRLVASLDTEDAQENATETFILKNADAADVAKQLQDLTDTQRTSSRYVYYLNGGPSDSGKKKPSFVSDRRRNAVIVQAAPAQIDSIRKMIHELDAPITDESLAPRIFQLKYVSAVDIEDVLNELFLKKVQQREYYDYNSGEYNSTRTDQDAGRLYGKVRITSEPYSNTIIVTSNSKENLAVIADMINQLDQPSEAGESTLRIPLKFATAMELANSLNILFARNGSPFLRGGAAQANQGGANGNQPQQQQQQLPSNTSLTGFNLQQAVKEEGYYPWLGGQTDNNSRGGGGGDRGNATPTVSDLVGRVRVVPDERGNALLVSANMHFLPQIQRLIDELDAASDQVSIEARIIEVATDYLDKLGVRWSPDGTKVFTPDDYDNSMLIHGSTDYQQGYGGKTTVNTPANPASSVAQAITSLRSGMLMGSMTMDVLIQFLKRNTDATVLGEPQITINNNETGRLFVGQRVPTLTQSQNSGSIGLSQSFVYMDVGVILEVTPHINTAGDVQLKIHAESSVTSPQFVLNSPVIDSRAFKTELTSKDGQTLILGGIIQRQISDVDRKTPILGDIPVIRWAFKKKDKTSRQVELMVFLRSKIIHSPGEAQELLEQMDKRAPSLKKWSDETIPNEKDAK
jgi:type II secretion system protein D